MLRMDINNRDHIYTTYIFRSAEYLDPSYYWWCIFLNHPCNYIAKSTRRRGDERVPLLRAFARRLAVSWSASMRRLTNSSSREQTLVRAIVPFFPRSIFPFFPFLSLFFFYFFSRDSTIAGTGFRCIPSLPLRSEPSSFVRRGTRGNDLLFTRFFTRLATATRRRDRRLRVAPELDKILLRENTSAFLPPSSTSPAIRFLAHFPVRPPWSFPLLPLRLGDHAWGCLAGEESCAKRNYRAR